MGAVASWGHHWDVLRDAWAGEGQRRKARINWRETDFLPAALEIVETPSNPLGRLLLWSMMATVAAAILWSCLAHVDVVAVASAKIVAADHNKLLQATDAGVVRHIYVRDGQMVHKGQPLVALDPVETGADLAQAEAALATASVDAALERAVIAGLNGGNAIFTAPPGTPEVVALPQRALLQSRLAEYRSQFARVVSQAREAQAQQGEASAQIARLTATMPYLSERIDRRQTLVAKGFASRMQQLELEEQKVDRQQQIVVDGQTRARAEASLAGARQQLVALREGARKEAYLALAKAETEISQRSEDVTKARERSRLRVLTAPVDGTVQQLAVYTEGAVMKGADPILVIVPRGEPLVVEAKLLNRDIGFVRAGQLATIKIEAFPFTRYGTLHGRLVSVSTDALDDDKLGPVYQARIILDCEAQRTSLCQRVSNGLRATAEIKTSDRRVIDFLLSPLTRRLAEAGRER